MVISDVVISMEDANISVQDLTAELATALALDSGQEISAGKLKALLLDEASSEAIDLRQATSVTMEQMWLLFAGWKFRVGQTYDLLGSEPDRYDFWEQTMPQTKSVFAALSRRVVHTITALTRQHDRKTGVSLAGVYIEALERGEPAQQTYTRTRFHNEGLKVIRSHQ